MESTLITCLLIFFARIADVSLGTIRTISVINGRAMVSWILGFFEILVWLFAVSKVLTSLNVPAYALAYALGYATGNYIGVRLESAMAFGKQVLRVFTKKGEELTRILREQNCRVMTFEGQGVEGGVNLLFIETPRRRVPALLKHVSAADPACYFLVDDIRMASSPTALPRNPTGWRAILKKK